MIWSSVTFGTSYDIFSVEAEVDAGDGSAVAAEGADEPRVRERLFRLLLLLEPLLLPGSVLLLRCLCIALRFFHVYQLEECFLIFLALGCLQGPS